MKKTYVISVVDLDICEVTLWKNKITNKDIYSLVKQGCAKQLSGGAFGWTIEEFDNEEKARDQFNKFKTEFDVLSDTLISLKE